MSHSRPPLEQLLRELGAVQARVRASAAKGLGLAVTRERSSRWFARWGTARSRCA
jgi:hypothetical protein